MNPSTRPPDPAPVGLWVGVAVGFPLIAYGIRGVLVDARYTHPAELARWVIGAALVHDVLVVPATWVLGAVLHRRIRRPATWAAVRWALFTMAVFTLVGWPFVRGYGRNPTVPSLLARNYGAGLLAALGVIAAVAVGWGLVAGRQPVGDRAGEPDPHGSRPGGSPDHQGQPEAGGQAS